MRNIHDLDYINYDAINGLRVGALTTIASIEKSSLIRSEFSILAQAASMLGTPAIRNQATIGVISVMSLHLPILPLHSWYWVQK